MGGQNTTNAPLQFLSSWKEIANYLGKGVRTVQRYEHELHLPVRRPANRARGSVIATKVEIDAWVKAIPLREVYRRSAPNGDSHLSVLQNLNANAIRMSTLCQDMVGLRAELEVTRNELRNSLATLRQQLQENLPDEVSELLLPKGSSTRVH